MARIRTIKPDFWTDEKITECSVSARLFFIGCWNFADDNGNTQRSAKKLKMQIFPADAIECEPLIQELMTHGLLMEYSVSGDKYLHVKGFEKHQVINRPSKTGLPKPVFTDGSVSTPDLVIDGSLTEGKGREGKGIKETCAELELQAQGADAPPPVVAIPLNDGSEHGISASQVEEWSSTYPNVDVTQQLRQMRQWSIANPTKRKTRRGVMAFANSWLAKEQDKPSKPRSESASGSGEKYL
ncbi:hypothetical protein [Pararobbsia alpina]|uniref:DnaT DNA-binding domain-containing protein n=1 Tax=Pararobbsia alpina TaxID=621374 RepID=A0A6S7B190_9BURK|nr:hypothetical protein [Pararobbsia alpina]CAB3784502.1 hypothetical protein LMG28138_01822 [Pararobbsia alpina]